MSDSVTEISVDTGPTLGWLQRIRLAFKSPYVAYLEGRVAELEAREKLLWDRLLPRAGYAPLTGTQRESKPNVTPVHPWRIMAQREAAAWDQFNEQFPSMEEVEAARKGV